MFQIGESLREARMRRGLSPADVHKAIRIRERYLTALEEESWEMLPGEAYTKGFLRTYAEHLSLNSQLYIDEYNARVARHDEEPTLVPHPSAPTPRRVRRGMLVALASIVVVAAVAGLAAWRLAGTSGPPHARQQPSGAAGVGAAAPTPAAQPQTRTGAKPIVSAAPAFTRISAARGRSWLLVRAGGPSGTVLYEGILEQGQTKRFQLRPRLWVRMGRPSALDITLAGKTVDGLPESPSNLLLTRTGARSA